MNKYSKIYIAILGIMLGFILALFFFRISIRNSKLRVRNDGSWNKLTLILNEVKKHYVDSVDVSEVTDAAVVSALATLDPHSIYMPPKVLEESQTELNGNFDGIGIQFNVPNDTAVVLDVIPGGPSEKVGLMKGDRILKINDKNVAGVKFPQDSLVRNMKGRSGTKVKITIGRDKEIIPFEITRGKIPINSIDAYFMVNDTTGYVKLKKFTRTTFSEFTKASKELLAQGMTKMIFDLRDNPGGYFDQSMLLSNEFLQKGDEIVYMEGRNYPKKNYLADGNGKLKDVKLTVLINESSASSSEIFAGAIQDNDRGVIVGRRSYGKGLVQEPIFFTDGSGVRITIARFHTPSGRCIQKPYDNSMEYQYDIYKRYSDGELLNKDSIKVNKDDAYKTKAGRTVYGGGGIIPDVFEPLDTTAATKYFITCNKKALQMRYASNVFDRYKNKLASIDNYEDLNKFLKALNIPADFQRFTRKNGVIAKSGEWKKSEAYMLPQVRALIARYSKLGENAFYKTYLTIDKMYQHALLCENVGD